MNISLQNLCVKFIYAIRVKGIEKKYLADKHSLKNKVTEHIRRRSHTTIIYNLLNKNCLNL